MSNLDKNYRLQMYIIFECESISKMLICRSKYIFANYSLSNK